MRRAPLRAVASAGHRQVNTAPMGHRKASPQASGRHTSESEWSPSRPAYRYAAGSGSFRSCLAPCPKSAYALRAGRTSILALQHPDAPERVAARGGVNSPIGCRPFNTGCISSVLRRSPLRISLPRGGWRAEALHRIPVSTPSGVHGRPSVGVCPSRSSSVRESVLRAVRRAAPPRWPGRPIPVRRRRGVVAGTAAAGRSRVRAPVAASRRSGHDGCLPERRRPPLCGPRPRR